jgi:transcriptional regulator with XRE-family HTH domain
MEGTFGHRLRRLRRAAGLTQRQLAKEVGVDFSYISKLENGRLPPPAAETVMRICDVLGVRPGHLFTASGKIPPEIEKAISSSAEAINFLAMAQAMRLTESEWGALGNHLGQLRQWEEPCSGSDE